MNKLIAWLKRPRGIFLCLIYLLTLLSVAGALAFVIIMPEDGVLEVISYIVYALAAVSFGYTVYTAVIYGRSLPSRIVAYLMKYPLTKRLIENFGFRTLVTSSISFAVGIVYACFNGFLGISAGSIWFGALSAYYLLLALLRGGLLLGKKKSAQGTSPQLISAKAYSRCGWVLLLLNIALSSAIAQMILDDRSFEYAGWIVYAFAAYAFYKITMSIINVFRARRLEDLTVVALREIGIVDAAVSILALQTALLHTFTDGMTNISLFNTLTGSAVSVFSLYLSVAMIIKGIKIRKRLEKQG